MFDEDFSQFTDTSEHGETATLGLKDVDGIFDEEYVETSFDGVPVAGNRPVFSCAESDLPYYTYGTVITVKGIAYKIRNWQPDGTGWITLILEKQDQ